MSFLLRNWARLYSNQTPAERALEPAVAALGLVYRTQHPIWALAVFADFVIIPLKLVLEIDGPDDLRAAKKKKDAERTRKLEAKGWKVVRTTNEEALADPHAALKTMLRSAGLDPDNLPRKP